MINLKPSLSAGENRIYFGLWCVMKAPLLLSSNLPKLDPSLIALANNTELIAVNQDALGVQARKLAVDGSPLPWLVALAACDTAPPLFHSRHSGLDPATPPAQQHADTRTWIVTPIAAASSSAAAAAAPGAAVYTIKHRSTGRCLSVLPNASAPVFPNEGRVVLLPCGAAGGAAAPELQQWRFGKGWHTVTSVISVAAGMALAVPNATLSSAPHTYPKAGKLVPGTADEFAASDAAFGDDALLLVPPYDQDGCADRDCQNYDNTQMWYYSPTEQLLRHSTYTASINHRAEGNGYTLTEKVPTWRHHCLAHVLSVANEGSKSGTTEVWGGPLEGGAFVMALVNRGAEAAPITARFDMLEAAAAAAPGASFQVRDLMNHRDLGAMTTDVTLTIPPHDVMIVKLTPQSPA